MRVRDGEVVEAQLEIFEPPRFFEAFLRGRSFDEAPDITARICGICPVAYQMSACHAMEDALGVEVDGPLRDLRRLLYCGEWIESHALHVFMLHAPDFLGYESAIEMAQGPPRGGRSAALADQEGRQRADRAARRPRGAPDQRARRRLLPRADAKRELAPLRERLLRARDAALEAVAWTADARRSRTSSATSSWWRCASRRRVPDRPRPPGLEPRASTSRPPSSRST